MIDESTTELGGGHSNEYAAVGCRLEVLARVGIAAAVDEIALLLVVLELQLAVAFATAPPSPIELEAGN